VADKIDDSCKPPSDPSGQKLGQRAAVKCLNEAGVFYVLGTT
jgi:hypothetical protein